MAVIRTHGLQVCKSTSEALWVQISAEYLPGTSVVGRSWAFKIRSTEHIVFQLRVVAGAADPPAPDALAARSTRHRAAVVQPV